MVSFNRTLPPVTVFYGASCSGVYGKWFFNAVEGGPNDSLRPSYALSWSFAAGSTADSFTNFDTTTAALKESIDAAGDPQGTDAQGRNLAFYYGWRDQGALSQGSVLIDTFQFAPFEGSMTSV